MGNGKSSSFGCLVMIAVIAAIMLLMRIAPMLLSLIKIGLILMIVVVIAIVVLVIYFSVEKKDKKTDKADKDIESSEENQEEKEEPKLTPEQNAILAKGRSSLTELRRRMTHIKHVPIRTVAGNICTEAEEMVVESEGNTVFFLMCPKSLEG